MKELFAQKRFTGSYEITDEGGLTVALMQDYYYQDEKLARLMASAPELLEALETLKDSIAYRSACMASGEEQRIIQSNDKMWQAFDKAGAAIAKAKGE
jgi:hypothetical protein